MKKVTALFLAIIYLAFTTGMAWTMSHSGDYAYMSIVAPGGAAEKDEGIAFDKYTGGIQLTKAPKHLAAIGKIKIPRPGSTPAASGGFIAFRSAGSVIRKQSLQTLIFSSSSLFIKNCVFRI